MSQHSQISTCASVRSLDTSEAKETRNHPGSGWGRQLWIHFAVFLPHCLPRGEKVFLTELRLEKSEELLPPCFQSRSTRTATRAGLSEQGVFEPVYNVVDSAPQKQQHSAMLSSSVHHFRILNVHRCIIYREKEITSSGKSL